MKKLLGEWTRRAYEIELTIENAPFFKGEKFPFKSPNYQLARNHVRDARMFCGDLLRLVVLQENHRQPYRFVPAEFYDHPPEFAQLLGFDERQSIHFLKDCLRTLFYEVIDKDWVEAFEDGSFNKTEFLVYHSQFLTNLKQADQQLGLRLGEL